MWDKNMKPAKTNALAGFIIRMSRFRKGLLFLSIFFYKEVNDGGNNAPKYCSNRPKQLSSII